MADELVRPNGKPYRPRKPPSVITYQNRDDCTEAMVLRTHDTQLAVELASNLIDELELNPLVMSVDWVRLVPFDMHHTGYDLNWVSDPVRGTPCVVIPYDR